MHKIPLHVTGLLLQVWGLCSDADCFEDSREIEEVSRAALAGATREELLILHRARLIKRNRAAPTYRVPLQPLLPVLSRSGVEIMRQWCREYGGEPAMQRMPIMRGRAAFQAATNESVL